MKCNRCGAKRHRHPGTKAWYVRWKQVNGVRYRDKDTLRKRCLVAWYCPECVKVIG